MRGRILAVVGDQLSIEDEHGETVDVGISAGAVVNFAGRRVQPGMDVAVRAIHVGSSIRAVQIDPSSQRPVAPPALAQPPPAVAPPPPQYVPETPEDTAPERPAIHLEPPATATAPPPVSIPIAPPRPVLHLQVPAAAVQARAPKPHPSAVAVRAPRVRATLTPQRAAAPHRSVTLTVPARRVVRPIPHIALKPAPPQPETPMWYGWGKL